MKKISRLYVLLVCFLLILAALDTALSFFFSSVVLVVCLSNEVPPAYLKNIHWERRDEFMRLHPDKVWTCRLWGPVWLLGGTVVLLPLVLLATRLRKATGLFFVPWALFASTGLIEAFLVITTNVAHVGRPARYALLDADVCMQEGVKQALVCLGIIIVFVIRCFMEHRR